MTASWPRIARRSRRPPERLASQRFWQGWGGEGQVGASQSSGIILSSVGLSLGLALRKDALAHSLRAQSDYQHTGGETTRQSSSRWNRAGKITDRLQLFGSAQYERDRFAGFSSISLAAGLAIARWPPRADAGPEIRPRLAPEQLYQRAPHASELTAMGELNAAWKISPTLVLSENATAPAGSGNTTPRFPSGASAPAWVAISHQHPAPARLQTHRHIRFTLVYGF
jgi:putative salt-induced outer membrane protein